ncbi:MAG TPA: hypothetical protein VGT05_00510 [Patescibacteria group bacterium]|nr:hypothetical protein [Patescibacteria group bacterium]
MKTDDLKQIARLLDQKLEPIQKQLHEQGKTLDKHGKILTSHSRLLKGLKRDQDMMLKMLDKEQMDQRKRLKKIEDHLGFPPPNL